MLKKSNRILYLILILFIFFIIIWLFFEYYVSENSFSFDYDEGVYLQTAFQHARGQALYKDLFLSQPPLLVEALSLLIKIFGNNVTIARSFIIITGFFTLVCTYLIAKELFNYRIAIFAFIIAGVNCFLFQESRLVHSNMAPGRRSCYD